MNLGDLQNKINQFVDAYGVDKEVVFSFDDNSYDVDDDDIRVIHVEESNDLLIAIDINAVIDSEDDEDDEDDDIDFDDFDDAPYDKD